MEYYSAIKRNEIELFVVRWMDLENVMQSEVSQKENASNMPRGMDNPHYYSCFIIVFILDNNKEG